MTKRFTYDEVKRFIEIESNSNCLLLSQEYKNNRTKLLLKCECGKSFITDLNHFKTQNQRQCVECGNNSSIKKRTMTHREFIKKVYELEQCNYSVLTLYKKSDIKISIKHNKCGHIYNVKPNNFISGYKCPKCYGNPKYNTDILKSKVLEIFGTEYEILGKYKGNNTFIKTKHTICNTVYDMKPNGFLKGGYKCPKCYPAHFKTHDEFLLEVKTVFGNDYEVLERYIRNNTLIKMKHVDCGYVWETIPARIINGKGCPVCNIGNSKGEMKIEKFLKENNVSFIVQYRIIECRDKIPLPFDFAIFKEGQLQILIEFDGKHHFEPIEYYGGETFFNDVKRRDLIKNNYCEQNNIPLLRIPYWVFNNIEEILKNELTKYIAWGEQKVI